MSTAAGVEAKHSTPMDIRPDGVSRPSRPPVGPSLLHLEALDGNESMGSDDAVADEDDEMEAPPVVTKAPPSPPPAAQDAPPVGRPNLRPRTNLKKKKTAGDDADLESEEDDGVTRNEEDYTDSETEGEDELDSEEEAQEKKEAAPKLTPMTKRSIKTVRDLPGYAQDAYLASTYGLPSKLPVPMVLIPGLRSRKAPPIPVWDLTKRSRGRHVSKDNDEQKRYICHVDGCDKRFARGEHLKRHIRSIHTHEKPHQCPYPGCNRGFSRTDNMMQHMRTHDDWPDDETAAKINAEIEKRGTKKGSTSGGRKDAAQASANMPAMPWGMFPPFMNWPAPQKGGANPLMPMPFPMLPFPPLPPQPNASTNNDASGVPKGIDPNDPANLAMAAQMDQIFATFMTPNGNGNPKTSPASTSASPTIPSGFPAMPSMPFQFPMMPMPSISGTKETSTKVGHSRASSKADTIMSATTEAGMSLSTPGAGPSSSPIDLTSAAPSMNPSLGDSPPPGFPMPPGMQLPFMPMGGQLPNGIPWPLPAIAIPIPPEAPLPPLSQIPPDARCIPDGKGGHLIIIQPPPLPWGMPFPPGAMLPPAAVPPSATEVTPQAAQPTNGSTTEKVPISAD